MIDEASGDVDSKAESKVGKSEKDDVAMSARHSVCDGSLRARAWELRWRTVARSSPHKNWMTERVQGVA